MHLLNYIKSVSEMYPFLNGFGGGDYELQFLLLEEF